MELPPVTTDRTQKFIGDLEIQKKIITSCTQLFTDLTAHFTSLHNTLLQKTQSLDSKFRSLNAHSEITLQSLSERRRSIPDLESELSAKISDQKETALSQSTNPPETLSESLRFHARRMDSGGLLRYVVSKRKESVALRAEMGRALSEEAVDPAKLVLDAVEEFLRDKKEGVGVTDKRWACGLLVQAVFAETKLPFARKVVERVTGVLEKWKDEGGGIVGPTEAVMFLQMVIGVGLKDMFGEELLRKLVVEHAARRDMAKIASNAGFGDEMGDIIDELVKKGKEIEAVYFACESGLAERFPPVSLLKSYLKNSKKNATNILKNGKYSAAATEESNALELNSIRAIIKCVEDNKLEPDFSLDVLKKRATQLEKIKADRKKSSAATASKPRNKRGHSGNDNRSSGLPGFRPAKAAKFSNVYSSFGHRTAASPTQPSPTYPPPRFSPAARYSVSYNYPSQGIYEGHSTTPYASSYGVPHTQSPTTIPQQHYSVPHDNVSAAGFRSSVSYGGQSSYAYEYGSGTQPAYHSSSSTLDYEQGGLTR